jgi:hypothetical protein
MSKGINLVVLTGACVTDAWARNGTLYARVQIADPENRDGFSFVTLVFPDGAARGLKLSKGQRVTVHRAQIKSRDIVESLDGVLGRAADGEDGKKLELKPETLGLPKGAVVPRVVTEFVVQEYSLD